MEMQNNVGPGSGEYPYSIKKSFFIQIPVS